MKKQEQLKLKADTLLAMREDANEYHFHLVDREWVIQAMVDFLELNHMYFAPEQKDIRSSEIIKEAGMFYGKGVVSDYEEGFIDGAMWYKEQI